MRQASIIDTDFDCARLDGHDLRGARIRRISTDRAAVDGIGSSMTRTATHFAVPARQASRQTESAPEQNRPIFTRQDWATRARPTGLQHRCGVMSTIERGLSRSNWLKDADPRRLTEKA
jgi:hypothetical protein